MSETFEQMAIRKWQEVCKSLSVGAPVAIEFAAAIRDELSKGAEPVAAQHRFRHPQKTMPDWSMWQPAEVNRTRPSYKIDSIGYEVEYRLLYPCPPSLAARIAELEKQRGALLVALEKLADVFANIGITSGLYDDEQDALKKAYAAIANAKEGSL